MQVNVEDLFDEIAPARTPGTSGQYEVVVLDGEGNIAPVESVQWDHDGMQLILRIEGA